jgi:hypothetical protein
MNYSKSFEFKYFIIFSTVAIRLNLAYEKVSVSDFYLYRMAAYISVQNNTQTSPPKIIKTVNGMIEGTVEKSGVRSFKGVPFAAPPVGNLRWKEPQLVKNWQGVRNVKSLLKVQCRQMFIEI